MMNNRQRLGIVLTVVAAGALVYVTVTEPEAKLIPPASTTRAPLAPELLGPPPPSSGPLYVLEANSATTAAPEEAPTSTAPSAPLEAKAVEVGQGWRAPSVELLDELGRCESQGSGDYRAVSPSGVYRGRYQFDRRTWNDLAARRLPELAGIDPAAASAASQDAMALLLWLERGPRPWPVCGPRALALHPQG